MQREIGRAVMGCEGMGGKAWWLRKGSYTRCCGYLQDAVAVLFLKESTEGIGVGQRTAGDAGDAGDEEKSA